VAAVLGAPTFVAIRDHAAIAEESEKGENKDDRGPVPVIAAVSRELDKVFEPFEGLDDSVNVEASTGCERLKIARPTWRRPWGGQ
jgi:hypothetical protein